MAFDLGSITTDDETKPPRLFVYATQGIGKSTFASDAPSPVFIQTEDGLAGLRHVKRFPQIVKASDEVLIAIESLYKGGHGHQTVVLDSVDWLENIIISEIEEKYSAKDLAFGRHAIYLAERWREILAGFSALHENGMIVILIGHSEIKRFDSPEVDSYDRYQPKLRATSSALIQEWSDCVFFANYKTTIKTQDLGFNKERSRAVSNGDRMIFTREKPAYLAKNRYGLPESFKLEWQAFEEAMTNATNR